MIVVKIGGSSLEHVENVARGLKGRRAVLVHGIGPQMDEATRKLGMEPRWHASAQGISSRYADKETIELFNQVSCGITNKIEVTLQTQHIDSKK